MHHKDTIWVYNPSVQPEQAAPGVIRKTLAYCGQAMCVENRFETGAIGTLHSHPHTQITYVAEGKFRFAIGGETREVAKGDTLLKQNGVFHGCECLEKGVLIDFFTPMREDFIHDE
ncbi:MAG: cupin domain-containing protein [Spirochaetaceae bacterium]|jgi:quercetin dioxygenase-like cupin family protein|nr:cupin domain-containing protein [Spirochaetaceae bacterium]